jgi:His-Xaa-Ser system radical SAM maturase HxsB
VSVERTIRLERPQVTPEKLGFFRYGDVGGKVLLTNDAGDWHFLEKPDFRLFLRGGIDAAHPQHPALRSKGFLRDGLDLEALAERVRRKKQFLERGPHLHIVLTTLRCNQSCRYCHASRTTMDRVDTDMSVETARQAVDLAMQSSSPYINFEFQGGEPTVNFPVIQAVVEYSREKNRTLGKVLEHSIVTNMTAMTEEKAEWLIKNKVLVCTSLDGPEALHNWNRTWSNGKNAFGEVMRWIQYFKRRHRELGRDPKLWHVDALMTTTRKTFEHWKEVVDLYVELGIKNIHLRPLNPYGFAMSPNSWAAIGYSMEEYLDFYARCLGYIVDLNLKGVEIMEATASIFLVKILTGEDPNYVDIRSPAGQGLGALAYSYDGRIFPSDEGRMVAAMGDDSFHIGTLGRTTYDELMWHPTLRALALASIQDSLPACHTCWNKPYCGIDPIDNYMVSGDIFGQRPRSPNHKEYYGVASLLFERLANDPTGRIETIFRRWIVPRPYADSTPDGPQEASNG